MADALQSVQRPKSYLSNLQLQNKMLGARAMPSTGIHHRGELRAIARGRTFGACGASKRHALPRCFCLAAPEYATHSQTDAEVRTAAPDFRPIGNCEWFKTSYVAELLMPNELKYLLMLRAACRSLCSFSTMAILTNPSPFSPYPTPAATATFASVSNCFENSRLPI